jgi:hypothetical protein
MIGSKLGQVYNNDQGKGLAVILDTSGYWKQRALAQQQDARAEATKQKQQAANLKKLEDFRPDVKWPEYLNQIKSGFDNLFEVSARHVTQNNVDVMTSPDETSREIRKNFNQLSTATQRVNILKGEHDERMQDINTRGDKYTQESIEAVTKFTEYTSLEDMARGYRVKQNDKGEEVYEPVRMPELKYKNPSTIFNDFYINGRNNLKGQANETGFVPNEKIRAYGVDYFTAPENEHNLRAANQMYQQLDPESVYGKTVRSYASQMGLEDMPGMAMAIMNLERSLDPNAINMGEQIQKIADAADIDESTIVDEDAAGQVTATTAQRMADPKYADRQASSWLVTNRWILNRPDVMAQLGIDINEAGGVEERYQLAKDAISQRIKDSIGLKYSKSVRYESDSRYGSGEVEQNFTDEWLPRIYHKNTLYNKEAANWLVGLEVPGVEGTIADASVIPLTNQGAVQAFGADKQMEIIFQDEKTANAAREKAMKMYMDIPNPENYTPEDLKQLKEQRSLYAKEMFQQAGGKKVTYPVNEAFYQVFKNLHNEQVQNRKELYKSKFPPLSQDYMGYRSPDPAGLD